MAWGALRGGEESPGLHVRSTYVAISPPRKSLRPRSGNDTSKSTGRSGRQKAAMRHNMRREERVTVQGPVKEQQPDGMSHRGGGSCGMRSLPFGWKLSPPPLCQLVMGTDIRPAFDLTPPAAYESEAKLIDYVHYLDDTLVVHEGDPG